MTDSTDDKTVRSPQVAREARRFQAVQSVFGEQFAQTFPGPYLLIEDHVIECPAAARLYRKDFGFLSKQLFVEYQFRSWHDFDALVLNRYTEFVDEKLEAIKTLMTNTALQLQSLLEQQGYQVELSLWGVQFRCDVPIIAVQARRYLEVLRSLDKVYQLAATANLVGVIDSSQRVEAEHVCLRAARSFRLAVRNEVANLYAEAKRVLRERNGGQVDAQLEAVAQTDLSDSSGADEDDSADAHVDIHEGANTAMAVSAGDAIAREILASAGIDRSDPATSGLARSSAPVSAIPA